MNYSPKIITNMNKSFLLLTTLFLSLAATAQEDLPSFTVGKIRYQIVDEAQHWAQVTSPASGHYQGITSSDMASTVTYNGVDYTVYGIGPGAFVDATVTGLLTLPDGLIYIDNGAFDGAGGDVSGIRIGQKPFCGHGAKEAPFALDARRSRHAGEERRRRKALDRLRVERRNAGKLP